MKPITGPADVVKVSKRDREMAALICAAMASNPDANGALFGVNYLTEAMVAASLGASDAALDMAPSAWVASHQWPSLGPDREAEAEALIRCGWSPS